MYILLHACVYLWRNPRASLRPLHTTTQYHRRRGSCPLPPVVCEPGWVVKLVVVEDGGRWGRRQKTKMWGKKQNNTSTSPAEPVVRAVEAQLRPYVPDHHPLQRLVVRHAPQLHEERVHPQPLPVEHELGHQNAVRRRLAQTAGPPLSPEGRVERDDQGG